MIFLEESQLFSIFFVIPSDDQFSLSKRSNSPLALSAKRINFLSITLEQIFFMFFFKIVTLTPRCGNKARTELASLITNNEGDGTSIEVIGDVPNSFAIFFLR